MGKGGTVMEKNKKGQLIYFYELPEY